MIFEFGIHDKSSALEIAWFEIGDVLRGAMSGGRQAPRMQRPMA
jgi:hypothetical protein